MAYRIKLRKPTAGEVERIGHNRLRRAIEAADGAIDAAADPDRAAEVAASVFVMRRRCKQVRALLRLADPYQHETSRLDRRLRAAARSGAPIRDAEATKAALERAEQLIGAISVDIPIRSAPGDVAAELARARTELMAADRQIGGWSLEPDLSSLLLGLRRTYGVGRRMFRGVAAEDAALGIGSVEALHDWRREAKYLRYQLRLLGEVAPAHLAPMRDGLDRINDLLGVDHDLWLISQHLPSGSQAATMDRYHTSLQAEAIAAGSLVFAERPKAFSRRVAAYAAVCDVR